MPEHAGRKGYFDSLQQRIALGYPVSGSVPDLVDVFGFDTANNANIATVNFRMKEGVKPTLEDKQRRAVHYLCEMGYGLCLAPHNNVSGNPGWEQFLKQFVSLLD